MVAGYLVAARVEPQSLGLTTEIAAVVVFLLGGMVMLGYRRLAVALGVVTSAVLAYKQPLHGLVDKLGTDDLYAGLKLLIATFIVLPLLPERADRSVGRAQSVQAVAAGDPDLRPVAGRLRGGRAGSGRRAARRSPA